MLLNRLYILINEHQIIKQFLLWEQLPIPQFLDSIAEFTCRESYYNHVLRKVAMHVQTI